MDISQSKVDILCPKCETNIKVSLKQVEKRKTVICSACGSKIDLVDKDGKAKKAVRDINKSFEGLEDIIKKLGK